MQICQELDMMSFLRCELFWASRPEPSVFRDPAGIPLMRVLRAFCGWPAYLCWAQPQGARNTHILRIPLDREPKSGLRLHASGRGCRHIAEKLVRSRLPVQVMFVALR